MANILMKLNDFDYELPEHLIATKPLSDRTASRMLHVQKNTEKLSHSNFSNIVDLLNPGDLLVMNNTKVIAARLYAEKETGGNIEILVTSIIDENNVVAMLKSNSKVKVPSKIIIKGTNITISVMANNKGSFALKTSAPILNILDNHGRVPLPPYMQRLDTADDVARYQTVYAETPGAIAAPTAGLHFDEKILNKIKEKGVNIAYVTLHVGAGTFQSVRVDNIHDHKMHGEYIDVSEHTAKLWQQTKENGKRVIAVGTTSVRSLESAWDGERVAPIQAETSLFITPGYKFNTIDALLTNFHLPKSTLIMLTCALGGYDLMMDAYRQAVLNEYRFFSYGDAMFIE